MWTDEASGKCGKCGEIVCRTNTQSCIDWCKYATECLGADEHKRYQDMKTRMRKETLLRAGETCMETDAKKQHARARVACAEQLLSREPAADPNVVIAAAALLDITRTASAASDMDASTSSMAADILHELGYPEGFIKEVTGIVSRIASPGANESVNFRVVQNAERLTKAT